MCEVLDRVENRGIAIGEKRGIAIGEKRACEEINKLTSVLLRDNRIDDLKRAVHDIKYQKKLMAEYDISKRDE